MTYKVTQVIFILVIFFILLRFLLPFLGFHCCYYNKILEERSGSKMSEFVKEVNDQNFNEEVLKSSVPVFVDFWAPWCGPCRMVAPIVEELAQEMSGKVKFVKVNVDEAPIVASNYGIMSIPTLVVIKNGQITGQQIGAVPKSVLKNMIENAIK